MIKPLSFAPGVQARLNGYGFDREQQDHLASIIPFKEADFKAGTVFAFQHSGYIFTIVGNVVTDFRLANPKEFDAEGCYENSSFLGNRSPFRN